MRAAEAFSLSARESEGAITVTLFLTIEEPINAISGLLHYSTSTLRLERILKEDSAITIWQPGMPRVAEGAIYFAGGSVTPLGNKEHIIFKAVFNSYKQGIAQFSVDEPRLFRADGRGTAAQLSSAMVKVAVRPVLPESNEISRAEILPEPGGQAAKSSSGSRIRSFVVNKNPVEPKSLLGIFDIEGIDQVRRIVSRSRTGFSWDQPYEIEGPFSLPSTAWQVELLIFTENGLADRMTITRMVPLIRWGILIFLFALFIFIGLQWRRFSRKKSAF